MHFFVRSLGVVVLTASACQSQGLDRQGLIRQVEAEDALAKVLEQSSANQQPQVVGGVMDRMAYDQVLKAAVAGLPQAVADGEATDLADLNDYQLQQAVTLLHLHNVELYVAMGGDRKAAEAAKVFRSASSVQEELARSRPTTQPTRSAVLAKYLAPPVVIEHTTMDDLDAASKQHDAVDSPQSFQMTPEQMLAAVLSGQQVNRAFGVPSTLAPTDFRMPGSRQLNEVSPRTLPLPADVPQTLALRADPPGNPSEVVPKPEEISRLASSLGVNPDIAEKIATGRMTLAEAMAAAGSSGNAQATELIGGLTPKDPRWKSGYYGAASGIRNWQIVTVDAFQFYPGGGAYIRSDQRVNNSSDMRTNGEPDRRINVNNDRRTNIQVDPRVNY